MPASKRRCESCGIDMQLTGEIFNERGFVVRRTYECPSCHRVVEEKPPFAYRGAIG